VKLQQAWPDAPHAEHIPFMQLAPVAVQYSRVLGPPSTAPPQQV
jgi:hypothetical protein